MSEASWWQRAACRDTDPNLFDYDPAEDQPAKAKAAKVVCTDCPVKADCLDFALTTIGRRQDLVGIYGGLTPAERAERRGPEEPRWRWRARDPEFAASSFARARQVGIEAAARELAVDPKTLRRAWDRHGLGRPPRRSGPPANFRITQEVAQQAFKVARGTSIKQAARQFGVSRPALSVAWERYGLGHPHQGIPAAELKTRWSRWHPWRGEERLRLVQLRAARRERQALRGHASAREQPANRHGRRPPASRGEERER
jgi:WhiB family transcriptional regulator, redox-sensing transcriptional regulator